MFSPFPCDTTALTPILRTESVLKHNIPGFQILRIKTKSESIIYNMCIELHTYYTKTTTHL